MKRTFLSIAIALTLSLTSCDKDEDRAFNIFSVEQDMALGDTLALALKNDAKAYPIFPRSTNPESDNYKAYKYLDDMLKDILKSEKFKYGQKFKWEITIIDDTIMNAFAAPGGKLYFYTGLLNYLDDGASLAGVLGHEMAHADLRHSTEVMTKNMGFDVLLSIVLGNNPNGLTKLAADMATGLGNLKFSRENEYDADRYSMYYLSATKYQPLGITSFFQKMLDGGKAGVPPITWLSTHPSDQQRIDNAKSIYTTDTYLTGKMAGRVYSNQTEEYKEFKTWLP